MGSDPMRDAANARRVTVYLQAEEVQIVKELAELNREKATDFVLRAIRAELARLGQNVAAKRLQNAPDGLARLASLPEPVKGGKWWRRAEKGRAYCAWCGRTREQPMVRFGERVGEPARFRWEPEVYCNLTCRELFAALEEGRAAYHGRGTHPDEYRPTGAHNVARADAYREGFEGAAAEAGDLAALLPGLFDVDAEALDADEVLP